MASVSPDGWLYIQHRAAAAGFIRSLGSNLVGFADYPGSRHFISLGNVAERQCVFLFCMD